MHSLHPILKAASRSPRGAVAFKRYPPPAAIRNLVESIWTFSVGPGGCGLTDCIPPDIGSEIICRTGSEPFVLIRGPQLQHGEIEISPGANYVGARLKPGVASWLLRTPAKDVLGSRVALATKGTAFCGRACGATIERTAWDVVERFIQELIEVFTQRGSAPRATIGMAAAEIISVTNGRITADALASALGCCTRHLRREMINDIGIGPKAAARISRMRCAIAQLGGSTEPLAQVALDAGYSDQAHMTREFAMLEAPSPATMRSWAESDFFNTPAPASSLGCSRSDPRIAKDAAGQWRALAWDSLHSGLPAFSSRTLRRQWISTAEPLA